MTPTQIKEILKNMADPAIAAHSQRFFKTGKGEYGEGDRFLGIRAPPLRALVKKYPALSLTETKKLLMSVYHEERLCALLFLVARFSKADDAGEAEIYALYLANTRYINNWDLVDCSALIVRHIRLQVHIYWIRISDNFFNLPVRTIFGEDALPLSLRSTS